MTTLLAWDGSGSVGGQAFYHEETQRIFRDLPKDTKILFWDSQARVITPADLKRLNDMRSGQGGTNPSVIADWVKRNDFHGKLVIITDGETGVHEVQRCDERLGGTHVFQQVVCHLIANQGTVNMSVSCPFTRSSPHEVYLYPRDTHERTLQTAVSKADLTLLKTLDDIRTVKEFEAAADRLEAVVVARGMGTGGDPALRDRLLAMKKRIVATEAREKAASSAVQQLEAALTAHQAAEAVIWARRVTEEYYGPEEDADSRTWSARISRLISICEGALQHTFDMSQIAGAIRSDRARRAAPVAAAPAAAVPLVDLSASTQPPFECPITLADEADVVLLVSAGPPLLADVDKDIVNALVDCPLNLFNYPKLVEAFKERLDHSVSLRAFQEAALVGRPLSESPFTRRSVVGGLCLGASAENAAATDWTLATAMTDGKRLGNADLWFACVYLLIAEGQVPYLTPILPQLRDHMRWRLTNRTTFLSLTGLPEFPTTRVKLSTALWYVFNSAMFNTDPRRDLLRTHLSHLSPMKRLLELEGWQLPETVAAHVRRLLVLMNMLSWIKRDRWALPNQVLALRQRCLRIQKDGLRFQPERVDEFVPIDGPAIPEQIEAVRSLLPPMYQKLSIPELCGLAALVDPSKSAGDIALPLTWMPPVLAPPTVSWAYGLTHVPMKQLIISPETCRPLYREPSGVSWMEASESHYKIPPHQQLSTNEAFGNFVIKYGFYPTRDEFLVYLYNRRVIHGNKKSLPHCVAEFVSTVLEENAEIMQRLTPAEFSQRFQVSRPIQNRESLENHQVR
jgi:hypothetical protein